ncbi:hypothetical protein AOQ84DRAFT_351301 [Glonium stellatum]|uniref:Uncharacterized protein n=1 Tax=Glonium stellatum TaxID=574774 RepID=A0A8E2JZ33_9PEZI|nr:hypothetical protein AOQ84DRAFT_351301 [Glonium stellatum]
MPLLRSPSLAKSWLPLPKTCMLCTGFTQAFAQAQAFAQGDEGCGRQSDGVPRPEECAVSQGPSSQGPGRSESRLSAVRELVGALQ